MSPERNRRPCLLYQLLNEGEKIAYLQLCNDIPWGLGSFGKYAPRIPRLVRMGVGAGLLRQSRFIMEDVD